MVLLRRVEPLDHKVVAGVSDEAELLVEADQLVLTLQGDLVDAKVGGQGDEVLVEDLAQMTTAHFVADDDVFNPTASSSLMDELPFKYERR